LTQILSSDESTFRQYNFYRAMRMHNTDYAVARCLSIRPSVRPSITRR